MPRDLLQLYVAPDRALTLRTTEDDSRTRLRLTVRSTGWAGTAIELGVRDVQSVARELMQWLADEGHELSTVELMADDDQTVVHILPEHTR
jgi:hypothetical protein